MMYFMDATTRHARRLAPQLRPVDADEIRLLTRFDCPEYCLRYSVLASEESWAVYLDRTLVGLAGYNPLPYEDSQGQYAAVWLVGSSNLTARPVEFHRFAKDTLDYIHTKYDVLTNVLLERNHTHRRWLDAMGAEFRFRYPLPSGDTAMRFFHVQSDRSRSWL